MQKSIEAVTLPFATSWAFTRDECDNVRKGNEGKHKKCIYSLSLVI